MSSTVVVIICLTSSWGPFGSPRTYIESYPPNHPKSELNRPSPLGLVDWHLAALESAIATRWIKNDTHDDLRTMMDTALAGKQILQVPHLAMLVFHRRDI